jgi:hypothetical protein
LTAYEIVDNTKAVDGGDEAGWVDGGEEAGWVDGGDEAGWVVEVVVSEVPLVERVIGATSLRGALLRGFVVGA